MGKEEIMKLIWNVLNLNCSQDLRRRFISQIFAKHVRVPGVQQLIRQIKFLLSWNLMFVAKIDSWKDK